LESRARAGKAHEETWFRSLSDKTGDRISRTRGHDAPGKWAFAEPNRRRAVTNILERDASPLPFRAAPLESSATPGTGTMILSSSALVIDITKHSSTAAGLELASALQKLGRLILQLTATAPGSTNNQGEEALA
jgi:hypothetical protein